MGGAAQGSARLAGGMAAEGIAGCRHVRVTTLRLPARSRLLKNSHHASGLDQARGGHRPRRRRSLVRRRSPGRAEEQDHPALGQARHTAVRAAGPAHGVDLYLRRHLSGDGRDGRSGPALVQHGGDGSAPGRDRRSGHAGQALRAPGRSGRLAHLGPARGSSQHHNRSAAGQVPGVEPGRERLAVPARQLVVERDLPLIRRHRRPLLRRLEPPRRPTLARHEPRITKLGASSPAVSLGISRQRCKAIVLRRPALAAYARLGGNLAGGGSYKKAEVIFLDLVPPSSGQAGLFDAPDCAARRRLMGIID